MYSSSVFGTRTWRFAVTAPFTVSSWVSEFCSVFSFFCAIMVHGDSCFTDRDSILFGSKTILIAVVTRVAEVKINKGGNVFPFTIIINRTGIMCRIQKKFFYVQFRQVWLHGKKGVQEWQHVMPGGPLKHWKYRKVIGRTRGYKHVKVIAIKITLPGRTPYPGTIRLEYSLLQLHTFL